MLVIKRLRSFFSRVFQHRRLTREIHSFQENILDQLNDLGGWKDIVDAGSILGILDNVAKRIAAIEDMSFNPVEFSNKFHQFNKNLTALIDVVYEKYSKVEIKRDQLEKKLDDVLFKLNRLDQIYDVLAVHLGDNEDEDGGAKMHRCFHTGEHLENVFEGEVPITIQDHVDALDTVISILKIRLNTRPDLFSEYRRKIQVLDSLKQHYLEKLNVIS